MIGKIVEIAGESRQLSLDRGFMVVSCGTEELGRVPLDDIAGLICNAHGLGYSNNLLVALAGRSCPVILCGSNHSPAAVLWPTRLHHRQAARMDAQLAASLPLRKRLWKQIVQAKLAVQAATLALCGKSSEPIRAMVRKVRAGDPGNVEGQGARAYWSLLMGRDFRRDPDGDGVNGLLNYGYAILRSTVARHLMGTGLHPGIPLHHANEGNPMRLVDDLMEPFRPMADAWVWRLKEQGVTALDPASKGMLGRLHARNLSTPTGVSPVTLVVQRLCVSLAQVYEGDCTQLEFPAASSALLRSLWDEADEATEGGSEEGPP